MLEGFKNVNHGYSPVIQFYLRVMHSNPMSAVHLWAADDMGIFRKKLMNIREKTIF